jgi:hypothetical protein
MNMESILLGNGWYGSSEMKGHRTPLFRLGTLARPKSPLAPYMEIGDPMFSTKV